MTDSTSHPERVVVFRTSQDKDTKVPLIYGELRQGRLRQGWGARGLDLRPGGEPADKREWMDAHARTKDWGTASPHRFAILKRMLKVQQGDIVIVPKMPDWHTFSLARVCAEYRFDVVDDRDDFGHIIPVDPKSVRVFHYSADEDSYLLSSVFSKANHRSAVSFAYGADHVEAAEKLLRRKDNKTASEIDLVDRGRRAAAEALHDAVQHWSWDKFEESVCLAFRNQGYTIVERNQSDGRGGDVDLLAEPTGASRLFRPAVAVQVKHKQGVDRGDAYAVDQVVKGAESRSYVNVLKCVITSAPDFTGDARELATAHNVILISGLQAMCFLLGFPDQYNEGWEEESD